MIPIFRLATFLLVIFVCSDFARSEELPSCFTPPTRWDNSWQNWVADNKCGAEIEIHYQHQDKGQPARTAVAFAPPCKRTEVVQTFPDTKIDGFYFRWNAADVSKSCNQASKPSSNDFAALAARQRANNAAAARQNQEDIKNSSTENSQNLNSALIGIDQKKARTQADERAAEDDCAQREKLCVGQCRGTGSTAFLTRAHGICASGCVAGRNYCIADYHDDDAGRTAAENDLNRVKMARAALKADVAAGMYATKIEEDDSFLDSFIQGFAGTFGAVSSRSSQPSISRAQPAPSQQRPSPPPATSSSGSGWAYPNAKGPCNTFSRIGC